MQEIIARHEKIALQVSGGRDSIACLYMMREYLDRITVYWCNTGAAFPETVDVMEHVRAMAPNFVEIDGRQPEVIAHAGIPSDIVPASHTPIGVIGGDSAGPLIQDRYSCCANVIMLPLHQRMQQDGITLVIRGQKKDDRLKSPLSSGQSDMGIEYLFPIENWSTQQVMSYLQSQGAPIPRFYEVMNSAPDCMTCSAYWETGAAAYLKRYHHEQYIEVQRRLDFINQAIGPHIINFNKEVNT